METDAFSHKIHNIRETEVIFHEIHNIPETETIFKKNTSYSRN